MLAPDTRTLAVDLLKPPKGFSLKQAVLTTYSLDLEALLGLPLAVLAHADGDVRDLLEEPLRLLEALRETGERIDVFVDEGGIAIPHSQRALYAVLETCVHPVRAPNGGVFHPKVWFARFVDEKDASSVLRVAVLSRNLTFDRSWDVALVSEGVTSGRQRKKQSRALGDLLRALPALATQGVSEDVSAMLAVLADELERTVFPAPEGFDLNDGINFEVLGLDGTKRGLWQPFEDGKRLIAVAPFLTQSVLGVLREPVVGEATLISRQETLDALPLEVLEKWTSTYVLSDALDPEPDDAVVSGSPVGLHAKLIGVEHGWDVTWFVGSANLTNAAFYGHNVEMMAPVKGRRSRNGIESFMAPELDKLCQPYLRAQMPAVDAKLIEARERLEAARRGLLRDGALKVVCASDGESWSWTLAGLVKLPPGVEADVWPISVGEDKACAMVLPVIWHLPVERLTVFVACRLCARGTGPTMCGWC